LSIPAINIKTSIADSTQLKISYTRSTSSKFSSNSLSNRSNYSRSIIRVINRVIECVVSNLK
jgi:hypothetical protein